MQSMRLRSDLYNGMSLMRIASQIIRFATNRADVLKINTQSRHTKINTVLEYVDIE